MNFSGNKSRPERAYIYDDYKDEFQKGGNHKRNSIERIYRRKASKPRKRASPKPKPNKYVPGEFIYDTKGQIAEIKYIGECRKGPGIWYGIEFVDGSLGKHNGTINGRIYFVGTDRRCDMIRANKIRSKVSKHNVSKPIRSKKRRIRHKRAASDLSCIEKLSLSQLSSDNYKKSKNRRKHKRMNSQPSHFSDSMTLNDVYFDHQSNPKQDRNMLLFGSKSREEKVIFRNGHRQYKSKAKQVKTVKKEKYKGNKYIMAMEQETEKRKHERIGFIKMDKKRVKQEKHKYNTNKVQRILKRKELEKEEILKLNQQNRLKELQRIQAAKQKSKRRVRSQSDHTSTSNKRNMKHKSNITLSMVSIGNDRGLHISSTPLADFESFDTSEFPDINTQKSAKSMQILITECEKDDSLYGSMDDDDIDSVSMDHSHSSYSDSDVSALPGNSKASIRSRYVNMANDAMFPVNKDSALLLQELLDQPMTPMSELISSADECPSPLALPNDMKEDTGYHFPIKQNKRSSPVPYDKAKLLKRSATAHIHVSDDLGTDYWIKQYNKVNEKWSDAQRKLKPRKTKDDEHPNQLIQSNPFTVSRSAELSQTNSNDPFCFPISCKKRIKRSVSLSDTTAALKRVDSAPIVINDDKGTDYWIKQYNKSNKKQSGSKRKNKLKSKQKKLSSNKRVKHNTKSCPQTSKSVLSIITPDFCEKHIDISPPNQFIRDDISDAPSSVWSDPSIDITNGSSISSLMSSPSSSAGSTPIHVSNNDVSGYFNDTKDMNKTLNKAVHEVKYGGYPFKRKREQYINKKFTGIVRIGHRYLLRDGRIGVVRYINATRFARGTWIGMELDNAEGEHNGMVHNVKYFECSEMYGTFVKKSQIAQYINRDILKSLSKNQLRYLNASK